MVRRSRNEYITGVETFILLLYKTLSQKPAKMSDSPPHCRKTKLLFDYAKKEKNKRTHTLSLFKYIYILLIPQPEVHGWWWWWEVVLGPHHYLIYPSACRTHYWPISSLYTVVGTYIYIYILYKYHLVFCCIVMMHPVMTHIAWLSCLHSKIFCIFSLIHNGDSHFKFWYLYWRLISN